MNQLTAFVRRALYRLKREYGFVLDLYRSTSTVNLETGHKTVIRVKYRIKRAIILPNTAIRMEAFDLAYFAANKNFTYGAEFDTSKRDVIIDHRDIPADFLPLTLNDYVIYDHKRYELKTVGVYEHKLATYMQMQELKGQAAGEVFDLVASNSLRLIQRVSKS